MGLFYKDKIKKKFIDFRFENDNPTWIIFIMLSTILCLVLSQGDRIGVVTKNGYVNCNEILLEIEPNVFYDVCKDVLNPDARFGE